MPSDNFVSLYVATVFAGKIVWFKNPSFLFDDHRMLQFTHAGAYVLLDWRFYNKNGLPPKDVTLSIAETALDEYGIKYVIIERCYSVISTLWPDKVVRDCYAVKVHLTGPLLYHKISDVVVGEEVDRPAGIHTRFGG